MKQNIKDFINSVLKITTVFVQKHNLTGLKGALFMIYLSSAMAVMLRVDTNTETDISIGEILQTGLQKLKHQSRRDTFLPLSSPPCSPIFDFSESERHREQTLPEIREGQIGNKKVPIASILFSRQLLLAQY